MHELTVAVKIRNVLEAELASEADAIADCVRVQVGALSNIVPEALQFAWPHAVADSPVLGSASLEIDWVDATLHCRSCNATHTTPALVSLRCRACRAAEVEIIGGDELDIVSVDLRQPLGERP